MANHTVSTCNPGKLVDRAGFAEVPETLTNESLPAPETATENLAIPSQMATRNPLGEDQKWIDEWDAMSPEFGLCYFIGCEATEVVKIGYSKNVYRRLGQLRGEVSYLDLRIFATAPGAEERERHYHHKFTRYRIEGEWFHLVPEIRAEIDRINSTPSLSRGGVA